jgi:chromosome segregation ATPase
MTSELTPIVSMAQTPTLGDRIRTIASQLRQEDNVQIKATSRILGAAAKLAENHDRLIDEVVEMVESDLDRAAYALESKTYSVNQLKQQFKTLKSAKAHFGIKANGWEALVAQLNNSSNMPDVVKTSQTTKRASASLTKGSVDQRLENIEHEIQHMREEIHQVLHLLERLCKQGL